MISESFEKTATISKSITHLMCLTHDYKVGGAIPCQAKATLLIRSKIVLFPLFTLPCYYELRRSAKFQINSAKHITMEFIMSNKLLYASPPEKLQKINLLCKQKSSRITCDAIR